MNVYSISYIFFDRIEFLSNILSFDTISNLSLYSISHDYILLYIKSISEIGDSYRNFFLFIRWKESAFHEKLSEAPIPYENIHKTYIFNLIMLNIITFFYINLLIAIVGILKYFSPNFIYVDIIFLYMLRFKREIKYLIIITNVFLFFQKNDYQ